MRTLLRFALVSSVLSVAVWAADVSGKWIPEKSRPGGKPAVLLLKVDGTKVTGSFTNNAGELPLTGVVDGDNVSFTLNADKDGRSTKFNYSGKVSGDTIKFTVNREGGTAPPRTMTFKREPN